MGTTKFKRKLRWFILYMKSFFNSERRHDRIKPSKYLSDAQRTAVTITAKTMLSPDSKLYYKITEAGKRARSTSTHLEPRNTH